MDAADALYGASEAPSTPSRATAPQGPANAADRLYGAALGEPSDLPAPPSGDALYGATDPLVTHRSAAHAIESASVEEFLADPAEAQAVAAEWATTFNSYGLDPHESASVAELGISAARTPPSDDLQDEWAGQAADALRREYGDGASQALQDARAFVASLPGAAERIDELGLGNNPRLVAMCAARGRALRIGRGQR